MLQNGSPNPKQRGRLKPLPNNKGRTGALVTPHVAQGSGMVSPDAAVLKSGVSLHLGAETEESRESREVLRDGPLGLLASPSQSSTRHEQSNVSRTHDQEQVSNAEHGTQPDPEARMPDPEAIHKFLKDTAATCAAAQDERPKSTKGKRTSSKVVNPYPLVPEEKVFVGHTDKDFRPPICGETPIFTHGEGTSVAQFATVREVGYNEHLMRFFATKAWSLPRPDVIISVTGGAGNFKLSAGHKDRIMKGMMEGTRNLKPWFITGGTDAGVMKYVGEARAKYNPHAPLIGIAPLRALNGFSKLKRICEESKISKDSGSWEWTPMKSKAVTSKGPADEQVPEVWKWDSKSGKWHGVIHGASSKKLVLSHDKLVEMDASEAKTNVDPVKPTVIEPNHSHFIFVDDEGKDEPFGKELPFRAAFESCESLSLCLSTLPAFLSTF